MEEYIYGILHGVIESKRLIAIKSRKRVNFYYMSKSMFKQFMQYFKPGIYIFLTVKKVKRVYKGFLIQNVVAIDKLLSPYGNNPTIYYDISIIKSGIKALINQDRFRLFIDFEMSMPPYNNYQNFISEIIQVGYVLTDEYGNEIERFSSYIKPMLFPEISIRTKKFLHIEQSDVDTGKTYYYLHKSILRIQNKYNPIVYVWGKNDQLELNKLNRIHKLVNFTKNMQFIDLLSLHKTYFGLKNDLGLFNAYNLYYDIDLLNQKHDALEDAFVTKEIFYAFKDVCNNRKLVNL
ncbi:MAG: exonuclease domain-containing protein [Candidatus Izemoplasmatales bacterium]|nr:exonuclease domain-containing protein [Candidatus Izemoplasmatales bacterium]